MIPFSKKNNIKMHTKLSKFKSYYTITKPLVRFLTKP